MGILDKTFDTEFVVCAIDIGVAVSSVSFLHVKPGDDFEALHDKVYRVSKWPFHKDRTTDIPFALCYRNGKAIKNRMGANAKPPGPGEDWVVVKNFKTFVTTLGSDDTSNESLPPGVTLARVYEDWLKFLFDAGSEAFVEQFDVPGDVWERRMCVFISPNEWGKAEQANVRKIIHRAGCIEYDEHVRFTRESEATLHYCLYHGLADQLTAPVGLEFFVCNSGITTDIGFFKVISTDPLEFEEVSAAISLNLGSTDPDDFSAVNLIEAKIREKKRKTATHPKFLVMGGGYSRNIDARTQLSKKLKPDGIQVIAPLRGPADFGVNE
ncbi:hypothetical protein CC2G_015129 [Coprinopsis cinerea AmutBmut pab1-1]|nr:hypothetical protein CC2G_015129 [Coprinopsis cinerea AmutBmut pab1-1]